MSSESNTHLIRTAGPNHDLEKVGSSLCALISTIAVGTAPSHSQTIVPIYLPDLSSRDPPFCLPHFFSDKTHSSSRIWPSRLRSPSSSYPPNSSFQSNPYESLNSDLPLDREWTWKLKVNFDVTSFTFEAVGCLGFCVSTSIRHPSLVLPPRPNHPLDLYGPSITLDSQWSPNSTLKSLALILTPMASPTRNNYTQSRYDKPSIVIVRRLNLMFEEGRP
ncbi:hypothetical protein CVT24_012254 [Panaeolus cyanescens]|uniref:Uncharacterized protein n=1 Tax=Panaeolus cyanescens TaxID=181874 RepID=A0A409WDU8_9AGAR|nr:hypothetical protein CVT24_012254 [Panaeolus cyanescens]